MDEITDSEVFDVLQLVAISVIFGGIVASAASYFSHLTIGLSPAMSAVAGGAVAAGAAVVFPCIAYTHAAYTYEPEPEATEV